MADLAERLLSPETVEGALYDCICGSHTHILAEAFRELHKRLATANSDLARKDRTIIALEELRKQTDYVHSERIKEKEILAYDLGKELESAQADLAAAREEIARKDEAQGHLARLCSERLDKIIELERQLINEKSAHAWTEIREQAAIDAARAGGTR